MKKFLAMVTLLLATTSVSAMPSFEGIISREEARQIAYTHAGVSEEDVLFNYVTLDADDGKLEYDIEFIVGNVEFDYEINAMTGEINEVDNEIDNDIIKFLLRANLLGNTMLPQTTPAPTPVVQTETKQTETKNSTKTSQSNATYITREEAKQIAFAHAGTTGSNIRDLEIEFDHDDGRAIYEIEWEVGNKEYEYEIDAITGQIIDFDID